MDDPYISLKEAAFILRVHPRAVLRFVRRHNVSAIYKQSKRVKKLLRSEVERYIANLTLAKLNERTRI